MIDRRYKPEYVNNELHPFFDNLVEVFGGTYQIWVRTESLGRIVSAGILNPVIYSAAIISIKSGSKIRSELLNEYEVSTINSHLLNHSDKDLRL